MHNSLILQRAMFLAPEPEQEYEWHLEPYRRGAYGGAVRRYNRKPHGTKSDEGHTGLRSARFNKLLFERTDSALERHGDHDGRQSARLYPSSTFVNAGSNEVFARMLVT